MTEKKYPDPKTKEEFLQQYAERSGTTVDDLKKHHQDAKPCNCGEEFCKGWQIYCLCKKCLDRRQRFNKKYDIPD